ALEALCYAGAIKDISKNRATAFNSIEKAIKNAGYVNEMNAVALFLEISLIALEALCYAGAIKDISKNRATAFNSIEKAIKNAGYVNEMNAVA
ncbi:hypothetical protein IBE76_10045, partial [Francisella tularensis]|uniref:hypothetical protein n=1 Tax=Francisella tularensis TaxID=263 RepID=UPI001C0F187C